MSFRLNFSDKKRVLYLGIFIFTLFSLLIVQFYRIQIIEGDKWTHEANKQHYFVVKEPFVRGRFLSNTAIKKGHPNDVQSFVIDVEKFHLYIDPVSIPKAKKNEISLEIAKILNLNPQEKIKLRREFNKKSRSRKLSMWLERDVKEVILKWWHPFSKKNKIPRNALFFVSDYQRSYPFGNLLGQVLHTIQNNKDEVTKQGIPTGGLELTFNQYLKGGVGKRMLMRSPRNEFEMGEVITPPINGADIYLTINHSLQAIAEEEITKGVKKCKAKSGWALMMDPFTGEILALAQYPSFYPPDYQAYFNNKELIENTKVKAITDANEIGSVMKPFILAAALKANKELVARNESEIFSPEAKIATSNSHFKGRSKPLVDTHLHRFLNMDMALQHSSNIYMAKLAGAMCERLGNDWFKNTLQSSFGFGKKTGIELPAESIGVVPTPGKKHPNGALEWSIATPYSIAMGHNIQMTTLQLVRAYAVLANGGYLVNPTLLKKIVKKNEKGEDVYFERKENEKVPSLDKDIVDRVVKALKFVTKPGGTSRRGDIWGYTEAGKSSTAKKIINGTYSETQYIASFVGFAPAKNPIFVLAVIMDEPEYGYIPGIGKNHHGGTCSAPVFREIGTRTLTYLGIPPDDPFGYPRQDPRYNESKADWMPETVRLQEKYDSWNK